MEAAWRAVMAAAEHPNGDGGQDTAGTIAWSPATGWTCVLPDDDPRRALIDLYLPMCNATAARPITVAHLGQSLDGFIATHTGESFYVTGEENIRHLHRLRALSDAIVVGAGTVAADDPQLTTRHVAGPNPLRVVFDPTRRLADHYRLFRDDAAPTIYVCARSLVRPGETHIGTAAIVAIDDVDGGGAVTVGGLVRLLRKRGCARIFVEGGGVTVSTFLEANLLDRLQVTIAPLIIGSGRPAIRVLPRTTLADCRRPRYRVFRMGADILFDCDLRSPEDEASAPQESSVVRVI
jgi:diaminohydroxyphosphoribosylaminopyrimidine deaminase / 5-amino-6-(5-phosphoribosylamino)uracil reductase